MLFCGVCVCVLPQALLKHLSAEHLLLVQIDGAEGAEVSLAVWT